MISPTPAQKKNARPPDCNPSTACKDKRMRISHLADPADPVSVTVPTSQSRAQNASRDRLTATALQFDGSAMCSFSSPSSFIFIILHSIVSPKHVVPCRRPTGPLSSARHQPRSLLDPALSLVLVVVIVVPRSKSKKECAETGKLQAAAVSFCPPASSTALRCAASRRSLGKHGDSLIAALRWQPPIPKIPKTEGFEKLEYLGRELRRVSLWEIKIKPVQFRQEHATEPRIVMTVLRCRMTSWDFWSQAIF